MKRLRDPQWVLILMFLGIIASVPLIQMLIEARQEDGVRAFEVLGQAPTAANLRAYGTNDGVVVPEPIDGMISPHVLVMTYVDGVSVDDVDK